MFGFPIANYLAIAFLAFVIVIMCTNAGNRIAVIVGVPWLILLWAIYTFKYSKSDKEKAAK
jgi:L-asparagine transporter-like permease